MIQPENSEWKTLTETAICTIALFGIISYAMLSMGVVTFDKPTPGVNITEEPTPEPTVLETPTTVPTPTPVPTLDWTALIQQSGGQGHPLRDYAYWYRENASGMKDLNTFVTVYGYRRMPFFHYHSWSWGTDAYFRQNPDPGNDYLFVFVNMYSPDWSSRQWLFHRDHFMVQIGNQFYYPDEELSLTNGIKELDNDWSYDHVTSLANRPYGYLVRQDVIGGTGIYTAIEKPYLDPGRSNAADGWIAFQIPSSTNTTDITVWGSFANLGGQQWWHLT